LEKSQSLSSSFINNPFAKLNFVFEIANRLQKSKSPSQRHGENQQGEQDGPGDNKPKAHLLHRPGALHLLSMLGVGFGATLQHLRAGMGNPAHLGQVPRAAAKSP
jgi:hypothetical protein